MARFRFPARFESLDEVRSRVAGQARAAGFSDKGIYAVQLAADEAASNIIEHAYAGQPDAWFEMTCDFADDLLVVVFTDRGRSFDFAGVRKPNLQADLSERKVGGLGIYLMQKLMDEVDYRTTGAENILTLKKRRS